MNRFDLSAISKASSLSKSHEDVELLDEVDDDDAPADIPSFEDLQEKQATSLKNILINSI